MPSVRAQNRKHLNHTLNTSVRGPGVAVQEIL